MKLEYVCFGTYGDVDRGCLVLDVPTLATRLPGPVDHRLVALTALDELRSAGAIGLIIARMRGVPNTARGVS